MGSIVPQTKNASRTAGSDEERESNRRGRLRRWLPFRSSTSNDDAYVRRWKQAWASGADARWHGTLSSDNPHREGSLVGKAWEAGWGWANRQPDRRQPSVVRFAVPQRRANDRLSALRRSTRARAVGLSALAVAGWLWQTRRRKG